MQTAISHRDIRTHGVQETNAFSIKANGKAFKVLIDGLYSNKIEAVVRELWTNAYDSHIAAGGVDVPFECHLPSWTDPEFYVRDFGTGLSHDDVMHLYTTVFHSSKEDTNAQVGKLGLGSKSPFAYTDTFTVTAYLDGEVRVYSAYIGADYVPLISLMSRGPTAEGNGLRVGFPVRRDDIRSFENAAKKVADGFDTPPRFLGAGLDYVAPVAALSGAGWKIFGPAASWGGTSNDSLARQGCVRYPLDAGSIPNLSPIAKELLYTRCCIDFPIGALEIAASREALGYDAMTQANIRARLEEVAKELVEHASKLFAACKTRWEASVVANHISGASIPRSLFSLLLRDVHIRGSAVDANYSIHVSLLGRGLKVYMYDSEALLRDKKISAKNSDASERVRIYPGHTIVYLHDTSRPVSAQQARIREHYKTAGRRAHTVLYIRGALTPMTRARIKAALGRAPDDVFISVNDLPPPASTPGGARKPTTIKVFGTHQLQDATVQVEGNVNYYVPVTRDAIDAPSLDSTYTSRSISFSTATRALAILRESSALPPNAVVYGVPKTVQKRVAAAKWINVWDAVLSPLMAKIDAEALKNFTLAQAGANINNIAEELGFARLQTMASELKRVRSINSPLHTLFDYIDTSAAVVAQNQEYEYYQQLVVLFSSIYGTIYSVVRASDLMDPVLKGHIVAVRARYPLLTQLGVNLRNRAPEATEVRAVLDYVNAIDEMLWRVSC